MTDAVVVGAGPAGAVAARTLARLGRSVVLVDGGPRRALHVGEALPGGARPLLRDLGLLALADGHAPGLGTVSAWGGPSPTRREALRDPHGAGWHLDRGRFDAELRAAAAAAGAEFVATDRPARAIRDGGVWRVAWDGGATCARHVVDATGRASAVARAAGARRHRDDRLVAFVAHLDADGQPPDAWTRLEAVPDGWWYTVRTPAARVVAFHTDADLADRPALLSPDGLARRWAEAASLALPPDARLTDGPRGVDAGSARLDRAAGPGWLAVGDAALAFDPLSSQGLLNALYTGLRGGEAVAAALDGDDAPAAAYADRLGAVYRAYLAHRAVFYAAERRWADRPFWMRRHPGARHAGPAHALRAALS